jgi:hypothetical protein
MQGSRIAARRTVNEGRLAELQRQNVLDYRPDCQHLRLLCIRKARIDEWLEALPVADSIRYERLNALSLRLGNELEEAARARRAHAERESHPPATPEQLKERALRVMASIFATDDDGRLLALIRDFTRKLAALDAPNAPTTYRETVASLARQLSTSDDAADDDTPTPVLVQVLDSAQPTPPRS